jgi:hypothetical protein
MGEIMRKLSACLLIFVTGFLLLAFSAGGPSKEDARKIISQYFGYPKPLMGIVHAGPAGSPDLQKFMKGINRLLNDGYIKNAPGAGATGKYYAPTSKSGNYVTAIYIKDSFPVYEGAVCSEVIKKIEDIRYDGQKNTAVITFTAGMEPVEPFYSLFCINKYCDYFGEKLKKTERQKLRLRKSGNSWRIGG